ncbi:MAG TPA: flagellin [Xanthobacteraceae bacterium]|nr:flagellin [Xanthobacteraceae bacterium]
MSGDIVLSSGIRANLLSLQNTASLINTTQEDLSTGLKVNSALDNPIAYFTASSLNATATNLGNLLDAVSNAVQTVQAANNGITSITKLVQSAQALIQQAQQSAETTAVGTGTVSGLTDATSFAVTSGNTITISDGTSTATITSTGNVTVQQIINAVNGTAGLQVNAELSANGNLDLEATGANAITVGGTATPAALAQFGLTAGTTAAGTVNATRTSLATQYNQLLTQIDQLASDSGFNGVNLLAGQSLQVVFNVSGTSSLVLQGVTFNSAGLGISQAANNFQTNTSLNNASGQLSAALNTLQNQAASFGTNLSVIQIRQSFTSATINTLQTGADNLTLADTNEEGANLLALQTRQSLAETALSLAAQSQNSVLRLFG